MRRELRLDKLAAHSENEIDDCVYQIHALITDLKGGWAYWDCLESKGRSRLKKGIYDIVVATLVRGEIKRAIALDVLGEDGVPKFESHLYLLLRKWYRYDVGKLIRDLNEWRAKAPWKGKE